MTWILKIRFFLVECLSRLLNRCLLCLLTGAAFTKSKSGGPVILEIALDKIRRPLMRTRANDQEKVKELMESIREIGLQEPVITSIFSNLIVYVHVFKGFSVVLFVYRLHQVHFLMWGIVLCLLIIHAYRQRNAAQVGVKVVHECKQWLKVETGLAL